MKMADADLKPGCIVELKSGGPQMTVRQISGALVDCEWFKDASLKKATFERHSLQAPTKKRTHEERLDELKRLEAEGKL